MIHLSLELAESTNFVSLTTDSETKNANQLMQPGTDREK